MTRAEGARPPKAAFRSQPIRDQSWAIHCVQERNVRDPVGNAPVRLAAIASALLHFRHQPLPLQLQLLCRVDCSWTNQD